MPTIAQLSGQKMSLLQRKRQFSKPFSKHRIIPHPPCTHRLTGFEIKVLGPNKTTMSLSSFDISRIANLARLELQPEESERMRVQINDFFKLVEKMRSVDTQGIVPLAHPLATIQDISLRLRPDLANEPNQREANQRSAPAVERGLFLVPKVID